MHTEYIKKLEDILEMIIFTDENREAIGAFDDAMDQLVNLFQKTKECDQKLFFIGNGGSAAIAIHMTADFMKNGGMKTCSMYDGALVTCLGNDYGYEHIFSKQIERLGEEGDLLVAISSSGNSPNIVNGVTAAKGNGMYVITLSGFKEDNKIRKMGDCNLYVPIEHYGIVESIHNLILQEIVDVIHDVDASV